MLSAFSTLNRTFPPKLMARSYQIGENYFSYIESKKQKISEWGLPDNVHLIHGKAGNEFWIKVG